VSPCGGTRRDDEEKGASRVSAGKARTQVGPAEPGTNWIAFSKIFEEVAFEEHGMRVFLRNKERTRAPFWSVVLCNANEEVPEVAGSGRVLRRTCPLPLPSLLFLSSPSRGQLLLRESWETNTIGRSVGPFRSGATAVQFAGTHPAPVHSGKGVARSDEKDTHGSGGSIPPNQKENKNKRAHGKKRGFPWALLHTAEENATDGKGENRIPRSDLSRFSS